LTLRPRISALPDGGEPPNFVALVVQSATVPSFQAAIMRVLSVDALEKITGQK